MKGTSYIDQQEKILVMLTSLWFCKQHIKVQSTSIPVSNLRKSHPPFVFHHNNFFPSNMMIKSDLPILINHINIDTKQMFTPFYLSSSCQITQV